MNHFTAKELFDLEISNIKKRTYKTNLGSSTGFFELDSALGGTGFEPGFIYAVAGRPGMGKTALLLNFVFNQIKHLASSEYLLYLSTKDSSTLIIQKLISISTGIDLQKIQYGEFTEKELTMIESCKILLEDKVIIIENYNPDLIFIQQFFKDISTNGGKVKFLFIDAIISMKITSTKGKSEGFKILMNDLQFLATDKQVSILIAADVDRKVEYKQGSKIPALADILGSSNIGHLSNFCLMLIRPNYYEVSEDFLNCDSEDACLVLKKNHYGPLKTVLLEAHMSKQLFVSASAFW